MLIQTEILPPFLLQELVKERCLPERAWIFFHVVTRRYAALMRLVKKRGERGSAAIPLDEFLGADTAVPAAERQPRTRGVAVARTRAGRADAAVGS